MSRIKKLLISALEYLAIYKKYYFISDLYLKIYRLSSDLFPDSEINLQDYCLLFPLTVKATTAII
jgi:UV DNA damage repair endonuclease